MKRLIPVIALTVALIAGGGWWLSRGGDADGPSLPAGAASAQEAGSDAAASEEAASDEKVTIEEMAQGAEDAPVTMIEYGSFTCPHCAAFHEGPYPKLKADYIDTGKVRFIFREVYFDKYGMWASMVARCGGPAKFFGIHDLLYDGQQEWTRAGGDAAIAGELRKIGRLAGLSEDKLETCLSDSDKLRALVAWYQANAEADDISATPTFIIDGQKYSNMSYADMSDVLDEKLGE